MTRHQYGIYAPVPLLSFPGETFGGFAKYRLFSQAITPSVIHVYGVEL